MSQTFKKAKLLTLIPILFFSVSGGPYGLEEIVSSVGPGISLLLILLVPLFWTIPECLIVAELSSNYPLQGGYYKWVQLSMGRFWGFMEGWWSIVYTIIDLSLYPILFTTYLKIFFPDINHTYLWFVQLLVIWISVIVNILGIRVVGISLIVFKVFILLAFLFFIFYGFLYKPIEFSFFQNLDFKTSYKSLIYGLSLTFWNFIGWDNATPALEEIHDSGNTYHKALFLTIPIIVFFYFFPVLIGLSVHPNSSEWRFGEFSIIADIMGCKKLSFFLTVGGMIMCVGIFNSLLLSSTRVFSVISEDRLFPRFFSITHDKYKTPYLSIIFTGFIYSILVLFDFENLLIFDVFFYLIAIMLEIVALIIFRRRGFALSNAFQIPFGNLGLYVVVSMAFLVIIFMTFLTLYSSFHNIYTTAIFFVLLLGGIPFYFYYSRKLKSSRQIL